MGDVIGLFLGKNYGSGIKTRTVPTRSEIDKTNFKDSQVGFEKKFSKEAWRKKIGDNIKMNGERVKANDSRDMFSKMYLKKSGKDISGRQIEKMLYEKYKMERKDRRRVMNHLAKEYVKSEKEAISQEKKMLNVKLSQKASELAGGSKTYVSVGGQKKNSRTKESVKEKFGTSGKKGEQADYTRLGDIQGKKYGVAAQTDESYSTDDTRDKDISVSSYRSKQKNKFGMGAIDNVVGVADVGRKKNDTIDLFRRVA